MNKTTWPDNLLAMGTAVRDAVVEAFGSDSALAQPVAFEGGDTIFAIDRHVEPVIERVAESWPNECQPFLLVAEGLGEDGRKQVGDPAGDLRYRVIIDPIDGTRNLMYDKRSAWFIAAVAEDRGEETSLKDIFASAIVELPGSKQRWCDSFVASQGQPTVGSRACLDSDAEHKIRVRPSEAATLKFGFAQVSNFFPGTKMLAAELMERIVTATLRDARPGEASVFEDQYISSAGQMVELMLGHDRFCCDLRPLFYRIVEKQSDEVVRGLECHPYDVAGALVAEQSGVIITDGFGRPLDAPLDVSTGVHWCGYANEALRQQIEPVIHQWLDEHGVGPS